MLNLITLFDSKLKLASFFFSLIIAERKVRSPRVTEIEHRDNSQCTFTYGNGKVIISL